MLRRLREPDELTLGRSGGDAAVLDACELRLERGLALAILAAVSSEGGKDGGRVGVQVLASAVGLKQERGRREPCAICETTRGADDDAATAVEEEEAEVESDAVLTVRPGGGGFKRQSWPSSGDGTKPPDGLG